MESRNRLRAAPELDPVHRELPRHRDTRVTCRPARPLPSALLATLAALVTSQSYAFAPVIPNEWSLFEPGQCSHKESAAGWCCSVECAGGPSRTKRGNHRHKSRYRGQIWLAAARGSWEPKRWSSEDSTGSDDRERHGGDQLRQGTEGDDLYQPPSGPPGAKPQVLRWRGTPVKKEAWRERRQRRRGAQPGQAGAKVELSDLILTDTKLQAQQGSTIESNNTELSQKVEAELFTEYDAMVPGPGVGNDADSGSGREAGNERKGRPLSVNLDLLTYKARQKALKGNHLDARVLYRRCVKLDPRDGRGWLGLARQMHKKHEFHKAELLFEAGLDNCGDNPYLLQAYAVMEEERGNQAKALNLLNRSVKLHPEHTASWVALGLLNERNQRLNEARGCFENATKFNPNSIYAWSVWAMLEYRSGRLPLAREKFKIGLKINPRNAKIYQAWGVIEARENNHALAEALFREGLEKQPDNTYIMQAWGVMEAGLGNSQQAISLFERAISVRPKDGAIWQAYALHLQDKGDVAGARALFRKGTEYAPKHCPTWQAWGMLEWRLGNVSTARRIFRDGVWESPKGPFVVRILQARAILEASEGNFRGARKFFGFALARDPFCLPAMVAWALMEESLGDIARARQLFELAAASEAGNPNVWNVYEQVEARGGFFAEAKAVYERGVLALMTASSRSGSNVWWDGKGSSREYLDMGSTDTNTAEGKSLLDQASRKLTMTSSQMALRVSRIIGEVQWANDYMSFSSIGRGRNESESVQASYS